MCKSTRASPNCSWSLKVPEQKNHEHTLHMKRKVIIKLAVIFGVSAVVVYVVAQSFVGQRQADKLTTAIVVLSEGRLEQAKELLSRIGPGDPAYPAAQRYLALCLHEAGDWGGFLKLTEQMDLTAPVVPAEIREELAFR